MNKKLKRPKKTIPIIITKTQTVEDTAVKCPHCKTILRGYIISKDVLRFLCFFCHQPIDIEWPQCKE